MRNADTTAQISAIARSMDGKRLRYRDLICRLNRPTQHLGANGGV